MQETSPGPGPNAEAVRTPAPARRLARGGLVALALAAAVGALVWGMRMSEAPPDAGGEATPIQPASGPVPSGPAEVAAAPDGSGDAPEAAAPASEPAAGFDLVRVSPDGAGLVAGRAEPGAKVRIRIDDNILAEAEADASGEFVAMFDTTPATGPRALTLETETPQGETTVSEEVVVLLPAAAPDEAGTQVVEIAPAAPGDDAAAMPADEAAAGTMAQADAASPDPSAEAAPDPSATVAATAVLRGGSVEATPTGAGDGLTLASISYGETGLITLAGLGDAGATLRLYVDDRFARTAQVDRTGRWTTELDDVAAGVYRLRIDALAPDGRVASRIETPFQRDFPDPGARPGTITVQPGNNLWTIARIHYGSGVLYTQIHTANRDLIRDPELIYPGQIFVLPEPAQTE